MFRFIDRSPKISRLLERTTATLARQRGLPLVAGVVLVVMSLILFAIILFGLVSSDKAPSAFLWFCLPLCLIHLAVFLGFLGAMIAVPLGEDFRSTGR